MTPEKPNPTIVVIFGASGDLTWRKLVPALYNLWRDEWITRQFSIIGVDRRGMTDEEFRKHLREGVDQFSRQTVTDEARWTRFVNRICFLTGGFGRADTYNRLAQRTSGQTEQ